jgi:hypothetical protein
LRELGRQARDRINADFDVNNPNTPPRASQKLIVAATLLRAMPAPSTPEAQNLHRKAQALIEQAAVQQAETQHPAFVSRAVRGMTAVRKARRRQFTRAARRDYRPTRSERRLGANP